MAGLGISFWTAREDSRLLGCAALKHLAPGDAESESMRTANEARGRGVASALLLHVLAEARRGRPVQEARAGRGTPAAEICGARLQLPGPVPNPGEHSCEPRR
ncbi:GNAT family N-acetyltransferase [Arthrobacter sp. UYCu712]|uniref:GNAT family N-acetyltransferase n=1 Tax=Arthrobacter sp. UYCu712 TaxID=3156340 RepID=UPI0033928300